MPPLVAALKLGGIKLGPGQCYSYKIPPVLGGKIEASNFDATDLLVHLSILGQIHHQVKDLPSGTSIKDIKIK
jgi:Domain of unknown function (DUF1851)